MIISLLPVVRNIHKRKGNTREHTQPRTHTHTHTQTHTHTHTYTHSQHANDKYNVTCDYMLNLRDVFKVYY